MCTLTELFCLVDDFCHIFLPKWKANLLPMTSKQRDRESQMSLSDIMTIMIFFHQSNHITFKGFYTTKVMIDLKAYFPQLLSYNRFVERMKDVFVPLYCFIQSQPKAYTGIYFIDSTTLEVCHIKRAHSNKVFKHIATKAKSTMGWYYGLKCHIVINELGDIMDFKITNATTDDRKVVPQLTSKLSGKIVGDKGYLSQALSDDLLSRGLQLITKVKKNMKNKLMTLLDKFLLRKRGLIETVNGQLKNISQIEHTRHRSPMNALLNILSGIAAYTLKPYKPSIKLPQNLMESF